MRYISAVFVEYAMNCICSWVCILILFALRLLAGYMVIIWEMSDFTCGGSCTSHSAAIVSDHVCVDGIGKYIWIVDGGGAFGVRIG